MEYAFCVVFFVLCLVPNIVFVSGLPIIDCPIGNIFFKLPDQVKDYNNDIYCFPAKYGVKAKTGCLGIRIMCLDEVICLTASCCSELPLYKSN